MLRALISRFEYAELAALFFLQMMAQGIWLVPLGRILHNQGFTALAPYAYATSAVAAFISPLIFGAMADRHVSPVRILRWLAAASAAGMAYSSYTIQERWPASAVLASILAYAIVAVPTLSMAVTIIFSRLRDSQREFGPLRGIATVGWMCGCWLISALNVDASPKAGYAGAVVWMALAAFTYALPVVPPPAAGKITLRERMGWDALVLLRHPDHRVVFLAVALLSIPLAAFYPFTPPHLEQLGFQRTSAWMSLGQVSEVLAMFSLATVLTRWRFKSVLAAGLTCGVLRYVFCAFNSKPWLLAGVALHGLSFAFVFITAQIYLNERVEPAWRGRAQALMSLMTGGLGNLLGYLGTGFWFQASLRNGITNWTLFWGGLSCAIACVLIFFVLAYRGHGTGLKRAPDSKPDQPL